MKSIDDIEVAGRRVLVRSDLNVPLDKSGSGAITDDGRIRASLPVIKKLAARGARVIVMAHLGRPKGEDFAERAAGGPSLRVVADRLAELLGAPVAFASHCSWIFWSAPLFLRRASAPSTQPTSGFPFAKTMPKCSPPLSPAN